MTLALQGAILISMIMISLACHLIEKRAHHKHPEVESVKHTRLVAVAAVSTHPSVIDGVKEFVVHIVVYSGWVFPAH